MGFIEKLNNAILMRIELIIILIVSVSHIVFGFLREEPDFNIYDLFNASPFFNFFINGDCNNRLRNVFHTWGGWKRLEQTGDGTGKWVIYDVTNITKINGNCFC